MKARLALVAVVAITAASLSTLFAGANLGTENDGNDVKGRLDVRKVKRWGPADNPGWTIFTYGRLSTKKMRDRGFIIVQIDTFGDEGFDYYALVSSNGKRAKGTLWRDRTGKRDRKISKLPAWRSGRKTSVRIPLFKVRTGGKQRLTYRWFVKTIYVGDNCRRVCLDRVPNRNSITESNGKPTPSPSPTDDSNSARSPTPAPEASESPAATPVPDGSESPAATESP